MKTKSIIKRYGFAWVTFLLFALSLIFHWYFGWNAYVYEQHALNQPTEIAGYLHEMLRDTFENWQSEFLQLIWQVAGLAILLHVGSPQSKEGDDRMEAKIDLILQRIDPEAKKHLGEIDERYGGRKTDPFFKDHTV